MSPALQSADTSARQSCNIGLIGAGRAVGTGQDVRPSAPSNPAVRTSLRVLDPNAYLVGNYGLELYSVPAYNRPNGATNAYSPTDPACPCHVVCLRAPCSVWSDSAQPVLRIRLHGRGWTCHGLCSPADPLGPGCTPSSGGNSLFADTPRWSINITQPGYYFLMTDAFLRGDSFSVYDGAPLTLTTPAVVSGASCGE